MSPNGIKVSVRRLLGNEDLPLPGYETPGAAGMDIRAAVSSDLILQPGQFEVIPTGFAIALPDGIEAQIRPRSGLAAKHGVTIINSPGTIDSDYRGEVLVALINLGKKAFEITRGLRIAQLVIAPIERAEWNEVSELPPTGRGNGGFGHTGI